MSKYVIRLNTNVKSVVQSASLSRRLSITRDNVESEARLRKLVMAVKNVVVFVAKNVVKNVMTGDNFIAITCRSMVMQPIYKSLQ